MFFNLLAFIEHQRSPPLQALRKTQASDGLAALHADCSCALRDVDAPVMLETQDSRNVAFHECIRAGTAGTARLARSRCSARRSAFACGAWSPRSTSGSSSHDSIPHIQKTNHQYQMLLIARARPGTAPRREGRRRGRGKQLLILFL